MLHEHRVKRNDKEDSHIPGLFLVRIGVSPERGIIYRRINFPQHYDYCFYHDHYVLDRANFENSDLGIKCLLGLNLMCLSAIKLV